MRLVLIGCGKMGGAMLEGWLDQGIAAQDIRIVEHSVDQANALNARFGVRVVDDLAKIEKDFTPDVVILAVKPQGMDSALASCQGFAQKATFLSIAAGKTIAYFEGHLGQGASVVRVMPNTPAAVRRGISVACANENVDEKMRKACTNLLEAIGEVAWVEDEALMDPVTAVSGSGPAYVFYLTECLTQAGIKSGLPQDLAVKLARATVAGAGELMRQSETDAAQLRINVTSPGGTTAAALNILMGEDGLSLPMERAVLAATQRSKELAG